MLAYSRGQQPLRFRQAWLKIGSKTDFSQGALFQEVESPTVIVGSGCPFERVSALTWTAKMVETQGNHWLLLTQLQEYDRRGCSLHCIFLSEPRIKGRKDQASVSQTLGVNKKGSDLR